MIRNILYSFLFLLTSASLLAQNQSITVRYQSGASLSVEGCPDSLIFRLSSRVLQNVANFEVTLSGEAIQGTDYELDVPPVLSFFDGEIEKRFALNAVMDGVGEMPESLNIRLRNQNTNQEYPFNTVIHDEIPLIAGTDASDPACLRNTMTLSANGAARYTWFQENGDTLSKQASFGYYPTNRDTVFVQGRIGSCRADTFIAIDYFQDNLQLNLDDTVFICKGEEPSFTVSAQNGTVSWLSDVSGIINSPTGTSTTITTDISSYIYVSLNGNNCFIQDTFYLRVDSLPPFTLDSFPPVRPECGKYCQGDTISIIVNEADPSLYPDAIYSWEPMDGSIYLGSDGQNVSVVANDSTYYIRTTTNNACRSVDSIFIPVITPEIIVMPQDTAICPNNPVQVTIQNPEKYSNIIWSPTQGLSCSMCPDPVITTDQNIQYTVMGLQEGCCPARGTVSIEIPVEPIDISVPLTCPGQPVQIDAADTTSIVDLSWTPSNDLSCDDCFDPIVTSSTARTYILRGTDDRGCLYSGSVTLQFFESLDDISFEVEPDNLEVGIGGSARVGVITRPPVSDTMSFTYTLNGEPLAVQGNEVLVPIMEEGPNLLVVSVIDDNGCVSSESITLVGVAPIVEIPNAFSPNGDDVNDIFRPVVTNAENIEGFIREFQVYARWGQLVYDRSTADNKDGWDGQYNGRVAPPEVYLYQIELIYPNGDIELRKGDVTLVR